MGHHHHLVCVECGAVDDVSLSEDLENTLEEVGQGRGQVRAGFG